MLGPAVWIKLSQLKLRLSFKNCNWRGLSVGLIALGPHLYIWFKNLIFLLPDQTGILIRDFTNNLRGCKFFSKLDLVKGYNQVPMNEADICKTAIVTPFGLFEFLYMPFGLKNAAQTFECLLDKIFRGLPFVFIYLDDVIVASRNRKLHIEHLRVFLELLVQNGLVLNLDKCSFVQNEIEYLELRLLLMALFPYVVM